MKTPFAKALSSWERHFKGNLKALRANDDLALKLGFILPSHIEGPQKDLPKGWLMLPASPQLTSNMQSAAKTMEKETGENNKYVFISPKGARFTSSKEALTYARKYQTQVEEGNCGSIPSPVANSTTVDLTSSHEAYMHRSLNNEIVSQLPLYIYTMWIYTANKLTGEDPRAYHLLEIPFHTSYRIGSIKIQQVSLVPKVPQIEGLFVPSPDVDPHKNALIKLLLFKPLHALEEMDAQGNPLDSFEALYKHSGTAGKRHKGDPQRNPYDAFRDTWQLYWQQTVLPGARAAEEKLHRRKEWPTIWECQEVFRELERPGMPHVMSCRALGSPYRAQTFHAMPCQVHAVSCPVRAVQCCARSAPGLTRGVGGGVKSVKSIMLVQSSQSCLSSQSA